MITSLLDNDFYVFLMAQFIWKFFRQEQVTYQLINRNTTVDLTSIVTSPEVAAQFAEVRKLSFTAEDVAYLRAQSCFEEEFLQALLTLELPAVDRHSDGSVTTTGLWWQSIWWESPALSIITGAYQTQKLVESNLTLEQAYAVGMSKLEHKIELLLDHPLIRFAEFGTRRRFSLEWQEMVLRRLMETIPHQLIGTSNVYLAKKLGIPAVGSMAHQLFMGLAALFLAQGVDQPLAVSQQFILDKWEELYGSVRDGKLKIFLTDTYNTQFALDHLDPEQAKRWTGFRQDSGDPIAYGENLLAWFAQHQIDPAEHFLLCSDGLTVEGMIAIGLHFAERLATIFGIGTNLVNDLIFAALNLVWKPIAINDLPEVKLSDELGKFTGTILAIAQYMRACNHPQADSYAAQHNLAA